MSKLHLLLIATVVAFASCTKKDNPAPVAENNFTYNQILDSLRITRDVPYANIPADGFLPYSYNTITFLDSNEVQETETRGTILDTFRYRINMTMETQVLQGKLQEGAYVGKISVINYVYADGAAFKNLFSDGKTTFFTYRRSALADTSRFLYLQQSGLNFSLVFKR